MKTTEEIIAILKSKGFIERCPPGRFVRYFSTKKFLVEVWDWKIVSFRIH